MKFILRVQKRGDRVWGLSTTKPKFPLVNFRFIDGFSLYFLDPTFLYITEPEYPSKIQPLYHIVYEIAAVNVFFYHYPLAHPMTIYP